MIDLIGWLHGVPEHRIVPLFDTDGLYVRTRIAQPSGRRLLLRSPHMESAVIEIVESGLARPGWEGLLYVMGAGTAGEFQPRYVGKAERRGVRHELSANLSNIRRNRHMFARWGDGIAYHIGDLSQALFGFVAYQGPSEKYKRWAKALFSSYDPPVLREIIFLYLAPWYGGSVGLSSFPASLPAVEKEIIAIASQQFAADLLNVDGR